MSKDNNLMRPSVADVETEKLVLGTFLNYGNQFHSAREYLSEDCFTEPYLRELYGAILDVVGNGEHIDIITVTAQLKKKKHEITPDAVIDISNHVCYVNLLPYVRRLQELAMRRKLRELGYKLQRVGESEFYEVDEAINGAKDELANIYRHETTGIVDLGTTIKELRTLIDENKKDNASTGDVTGFSLLDKGGGLHGTDLVVIAGATSQGKTSLALSIMLNVAVNGAKVSFYSLEMTRIQLAARLTSMTSRVSSSNILYSKLSNNDILNVESGIGKLPLGNIYFDDDSTSNIDSIIASIRVMKIKYDINGAVVDYLQILSVNMKGESNREQLYAEAARRLKNLAKELNIWIIALSQLRRDLDSPVPSIDKLRGSGQIAEASDIVILVYRPEVYNKKYPSPFENYDEHNTAMIDVAKGRNTGIGKSICTFIPELTMFIDDIENHEDNDNFKQNENTPF